MNVGCGSGTSTTGSSSSAGSASSGCGSGSIGFTCQLLVRLDGVPYGVVIDRHTSVQARYSILVPLAALDLILGLSSGFVGRLNSREPSVTLILCLGLERVFMAAKTERKDLFTLFGNIGNVSQIEDAVRRLLGIFVFGDVKKSFAGLA